MDTRRAFSKLTIAAMAGTALSASRVWGANDRIRMGLIGSGGRGREDWGNFLKQPDVEPVAVCDVYDPFRELGIKLSEGRAKPYKDFRRVMEQKDIDAVVVATPDHWHALITVAACDAGKDVYCEKPVTHTMEEAAPLITAVHDSKRVVQIGLQQRSWEHFAQARDLIAAGRLGQVTLIRTYWFQNHIPANGRVPSFDTAKLDWKRVVNEKKPNE